MNNLLVLSPWGMLQVNSNTLESGLSHQVKSRLLVNVTDVREFTAEIVIFGQPSYNGFSFDPTLLWIVQCEHYFHPIANLELVSGWNNKPYPGSGDVLYQHTDQAFGCGACAGSASDISFSHWPVVTFNMKLSAGVFPEFKKNGKTMPAFASQLATASTSCHLPGIHLAASFALRANDDRRIVLSHMNYLGIRRFRHSIRPLASGFECLCELVSHGCSSHLKGLPQFSCRSHAKQLFVNTLFLGENTGLKPVVLNEGVGYKKILI
jgi:hypothetical protein